VKPVPPDLVDEVERGQDDPGARQARVPEVGVGVVDP
jgi:hypothetical protein